MSRPAKLAVQQWGNSLAVRIPAAVARTANITVGQPVEIEVQQGALLVRPVGSPQLSLAQKLKLFDPEVHGGEAMRSPSLGREEM